MTHLCLPVSEKCCNCHWSFFLWFIPHNTVSSAFRVPYYQLSFWDFHECMTSILILSISNICPVLSPCDDYWPSKSFLCNRQISQLPLPPSRVHYWGQMAVTSSHSYPRMSFLTSSKWTLCFLLVYSVPYTSLNMFLGGDQQPRLLTEITFYSYTHNISVTKSNSVIIYSPSCCFKRDVFSMQHKRRNSEEILWKVGILHKFIFSVPWKNQRNSYGLKQQEDAFSFFFFSDLVVLCIFTNPIIMFY